MLPANWSPSSFASAFGILSSTLPPNSHLRLVEQAAAAGLAGGAIYDALIAATASRAGATLLLRDHRAAATYEALGVDYELVT